MLESVTAQPWEPRLSRIEGAFQQMDKRLDSLQGEVRELRTEMSQRFGHVGSRFNQLLTAVVTSAVVVGIVVGFFESISSHIAR